jgi:hypothetical protein
MEIFTWMFDHVDALIAIVTAVVALASMIAALTPNPNDDSFIARLRSMVDIFALNLKHAKPASAVQAPETESAKSPQEPASN